MGKVTHTTQRTSQPFPSTTVAVSRFSRQLKPVPVITLPEDDHGSDSTINNGTSGGIVITTVSVGDPSTFATSTSSTPSPSASLYRISPFARLVYAQCRRIPRGHVTTYSLLAASIGHPRAFRAVGHALSINPFAPRVPCHRVVASGGRIGGFMGQKDIECEALLKKVALLKEEGVLVIRGRVQGTDAIVPIQGTVSPHALTDAALGAPLTT